MNIYDPKYAVPEFDAKYAKTKRIRNALIACIPLGFIMFGGGTPLAIITERMYLMFIPVLGFLLIPTSIITMATLSNRLMILRGVRTTIDTIKSQDKTYFFQIGGNNPAVELQVKTFVQRAIENGVLEGYTIIGDVAVVKTSVGISEREILREYALLKFGKINDEDENENFAEAGSLSDYAAKNYDEKPAAAATKECYFCHASVPADATYCSKCGARLDY